MSKLPAIQFYPGDWLQDSGVQSLSHHDRSIWFEMLLRMHTSPVRGKLLLGQKAMPDEVLADLLHVRYEALMVTLNLLVERGVTERDPETGAFISRRMIRDEAVRAATRRRVDRWRKSKKINTVDTSNGVVTPPVTHGVTPSVTDDERDSVTHGVTPLKRRSSSSFAASAIREEADASSPCAADAARGVTAPAEPAAAASPTPPQPDPAKQRHAQCRSLVNDYWQRHHPGISMAPWDGGEARQLSALLAANPVLTAEDFERLLLARSASDVNHSERPKAWLERLTDYASGPLDRYGKPKGESDGANTASANGSPARGAAYERVERTRNAFRDAARRSIERAGGVAAGAGGSGISSAGTAPGHGDDVPARVRDSSSGVWNSEIASGARKVPYSPEILPPSQRSARGA